MGRVVARVGAVCAAVAVVVAGLVGCGGGKDPVADVPTATVPTVPPDPYAVPAVIDEAYVNRVLAALDQAVGDVVRMVIRTKVLSPEAIERLQAIYVGDALILKLNGFQRDILDGFTAYQPNPGNKKSQVQELLSVKPGCVFAEVSRDFSAVGADPDPTLSTQWISLSTTKNGRSGNEYNPTPWLVTYDGFRQDLSKPPDPCAA